MVRAMCATLFDCLVRAALLRYYAPPLERAVTASATGAIASSLRRARSASALTPSCTTLAWRIRSNLAPYSTRFSTCPLIPYCSCQPLLRDGSAVRGRLAPVRTTPLGWPRVQAICDFVQNHITFGYEHSRATRTAFEAYEERRGVCRDFAHLAVTFCRCLNIPARYCTGYITDIGLPPPYAPMDFAAWIEVYLGDRWHAFDPRNNAPRIGRILIAHGRDAADVPLTHTFGPGTLSEFRVWADEAR